MEKSNINFLHIEQQPVDIPIKSEIPDKEAKEIVNKYSSIVEKIELYMSLFRGREDIYAKRWENKKLQTSGYSPACSNEWVPGICLKPNIKCSVCNHKDYLELNKQVIENHLRGNIVAGVYLLLTNETCWFLAIDFDNEGWKKDISALRKVFSQFDILLQLNAPVQEMAPMHGSFSINWFRLHWPVNSEAPCLLMP